MINNLNVRLKNFYSNYYKAAATDEENKNSYREALKQNNWERRLIVDTYKISQMIKKSIDLDEPNYFGILFPINGKEVNQINLSTRPNTYTEMLEKYLKDEGLSVYIYNSLRFPVGDNYYLRVRSN
jgi:di/tripeptidase